MFEYLKGIVVDIVEDKIIMEVNGIGYKINSTANSISKVMRGEHVIIYTHLIVREDELSLYGFASAEELSMFQLLISVSKIGPRVASAILSTHTPSKLIAYILGKDIKLICKAPGVGKKTAERIVLELRDKVDKIGIEHDCTLYNDENIDDEAVEALIALGYNRFEAEKAICSIKDKDLTTEDILKNALKSLAR
ncbi:MAG: Holliday junction branch migration protein RuvA [Natronincolaceae bacterium]|jgi:Holliday junction DNA helicase RuvA|nr:Holliday junction branch migration protein RuvA [Bacillota bacterium]NLK90471.1 Holliday junction branch migration protein RuvA [Clostridiales bacterium]